MMKLDNIYFLCNHLKDNVPCYQTQDPGNIKYNVRVQKQIPGYKYIVKILYFQDMANLFFRCFTAYKINLACGHCCPGSCGRCNSKDADMNPIVKY
jgi:hypothetical protein